MLNRPIFRKTSLEKMTSTEDLDELLQVNSIKTWLLFSGICAVLAVMLAWGFLGSISQNVKGFGIIKTQELWRAVLADRSGQVDSVFCNTGDEFVAGQKLVKLFDLEKKEYINICATGRGKVIAVNVREGIYVAMGTPLIDIMRFNNQEKRKAEVVFFVTEKEVAKLKNGMSCNLAMDKEGVPPEFKIAVINFISDHSVSKNTILKFFPGEEMLKSVQESDFYEIRASMKIDTVATPGKPQYNLSKLNWLVARVTITVDRRSPISFLFK